MSLVTITPARANGESATMRFLFLRLAGYSDAGRNRAAGDSLIWRISSAHQIASRFSWAPNTSGFFYLRMAELGAFPVALSPLPSLRDSTGTQHSRFVGWRRRLALRVPSLTIQVRWLALTLGVACPVAYDPGSLVGADVRRCVSRRSQPAPIASRFHGHPTLQVRWAFGWRNLGRFPSPGDRLRADSRFVGCADVRRCVSRRLRSRFVGWRRR